MALLGWHSPDNREIFSSEELIKEFSLTRLQKGGAVFNIQKLDWFNSEYLKKLSIDNLTDKCIPYLIKAGLLVKKNSEFKIQESGKAADINYLKKIISLLRERIHKISDIAELSDYFFKKLPYDKNLLRWKSMNDGDIKKNLLKIKEIILKINEKDFKKEQLEKLILPEAEKTGRGEMLWPLRTALSGKDASCPPFEIMEVLGKEETIARIEIALNKLNDANE